eukprot:SAG31_NODE_5759_length_2341_cov_1.618198_2_plen_346_part_00
MHQSKSDGSEQHIATGTPGMFQKSCSSDGGEVGEGVEAEDGSSATKVICVKQVCCLVDEEELQFLQTQWANLDIVARQTRQGCAACCRCKPRQAAQKWQQLWQQPIHQIRNFYGEQIAFYFEFVAHYTKALAVLAVIGVAVQLEYWFGTGTFDYHGVDGALGGPVYLLALQLWLSWVYTSWKYREAELRCIWGTDNLDAHIRPLHSFEQNKRNPLQYNPLTGKEERVYSKCRNLKFLVTWSVSLICIGCVVATGIFCLWLKSFQEKTFLGPLSFSMAGTLLNVVAILIFEVIYTILARGLTAWENWRTFEEFENSIIRYAFTRSLSRQFCLGIISSSKPRFPHPP